MFLSIGLVLSTPYGISLSLVSSESITANNVLYVSPGSKMKLFNNGGRLWHAVRFCWVIGVSQYTERGPEKIHGADH